MNVIKYYRARAGSQETLSGAGSVERRFAYSLLEKLLQYLDCAAINMKILKPSANMSRRSSFKTSSKDVKFFSKVVLPLMVKYFRYFIDDNGEILRPLRYSKILYVLSEIRIYYFYTFVSEPF